MIWLAGIARSLYVAEIGTLLKKSPNLAAAASFYLIYLAGLTFFVLIPAHEAGNVARAALTGAAFGLVAYATYDLTNLATLEGFTARIALIDMAWGAFVTGLSSAGAVALAGRFA
jgi:uncharacterized membrane protein